MAKYKIKQELLIYGIIQFGNIKFINSSNQISGDACIFSQFKYCSQRYRLSFLLFNHAFPQLFLSNLQNFIIYQHLLSYLCDYYKSIQSLMWQNLDGQRPIQCVIDCDQACISGLFYWGLISSITLTVLTSLIAIYNVVMHYINFNNPYFQSKIIAILLMPPIYCVTSTLSFHSVQASVYLTLGRDFYEVFGLFAFYYLIFSFLAYNHNTHELEERKVYEIMKNQSSEVPHDFPCSYFQKPYQLSNWIKAKFFSHRCKRAILQFIVVKIVTSIFLSAVYPNYQIRARDSSDWDYVAYSYINIFIYWITTISSYIAYYYMGLFYNCLQKPLQPFKPDLKFMTFNTTIFFTYWQKVWMVIFQSNIIACFDQHAPSYHRRSIMLAIQHSLICLQMFIMIFACAQAYSYDNYKVNSVRHNIGSFSYILKDMFNIFKSELRLITPKKFGFSSANDKSQTELQTITASVAKQDTQFSSLKKCYADLRSRIILNYF